MADTPDALDIYFGVWRTSDPAEIRDRVQRSCAEGVEWCDPNHDLSGRDAVVDMVLEFHEQWPDAGIELLTEIDSHHGRHRYEWLVTTGGRKLMRGTDVVRIDDDGAIVRIDGFFGRLERVD